MEKKIEGRIRERLIITHIHNTFLSLEKKNNLDGREKKVIVAE